MAEILGVEDWKKAGEYLKGGSIVILPVDTVYSLSAAVNEFNRVRLCKIKERPDGMAFITLMNKDQLRLSGYPVPDFLMKIWPAPLTAILENGVSVRVPEGSFINDVLSVSGPIYSTSVNISGTETLTEFEQILPVFRSSVDYIVRDERVSGGTPSTLIDLRGGDIKILRQGSYILRPSM